MGHCRSWKHEGNTLPWMSGHLPYEILGWKYTASVKEETDIWVCLKISVSQPVPCFNAIWFTNFRIHIRTSSHILFNSCHMSQQLAAYPHFVPIYHHVWLFFFMIPSLCHHNITSFLVIYPLWCSYTTVWLFKTYSQILHNFHAWIPCIHSL